MNYQDMIDKEDFVRLFNLIADGVRHTAISKGFGGEKSESEVIALMHSELSEALEADRKNITISEHIPKFTGVEEEYADVIIRIMHRAAEKNYRVADAVLAKVIFNRSREFKHGGKKY